ncbi:MAG: hypothetical protein JWL90_2710, partial [Chthoniobacteraceae bacterium]|nr:hypothetical protein [Chthoniobacteraceae bacterium]
AAWIKATYGNAIKVMFTSGRVDLSLIEADLQGRPFLHKPAPPAEIAHSIREVLQEPAAGR